MPTIAIGSSASPCGRSRRPRPRRRRPARAGSGRPRPGTGGRRRGWTGSCTPVTSISRLRSSIADERVEAEVGEGQLGPIASGVSWPSTAATCVRTSVSTASSHAASGRAASRLASDDAARALPARRDLDQAAQQAGEPPDPGECLERRQVDVRGQQPRRGRRAGRRRTAAGPLRAPSRRARGARGSGARRRRRGAAAMPRSCAHRPQAIEVAGRPSRRRRSASASR